MTSTTKPLVSFYSETLEGGCGVGNMLDFAITYAPKPPHIYATRYLGNSSNPMISGGTGFFIACFIGTEECKAAYEALVEEYKLVFKSPVRVNTNTENEFFFCIFDQETDNGDIAGLTPDPWPNPVLADDDDY